MQYGIIDDLSNVSMFNPCSKLGLDREDTFSDTFPANVCLVDLFPVRVNRNEILGCQGGDIFPHLLFTIRDY